MKIAAQISQAFASGATILTANVRAARWLQREYGLLQRASGRRAWTTPPIEDWETWLRRQWEAMMLKDGAAPLLLTSLQERSVWARMQREDAKLVVSPANMAALAESAYALLSGYNAQEERRHTWGKLDAERFRGWAARFEQECAHRNWVPRAGLEAKVAAGLHHTALPQEILLVGFDRLAPAQNGLLQAFASRGVRVEVAKTNQFDSATEFLRLPVLLDEITACAWWTRELVEENPEVRIGIIAPDLGAVRSQIERVFRRVLMPESDDIGALQAMPFEFSLGQPLADTPVIRAALL